MMSIRHLRVGNSASAVMLRKILRAHLKHWDSYCVDIDRYQSVLEHALSKVDFSIATGIYMLPINLSLSMGKTVISNTDIKRHWGLKRLRFTIKKSTKCYQKKILPLKCIEEEPRSVSLRHRDYITCG